jgi:hypothetical protein
VIPRCLDTMTGLTPKQMIELGGTPETSDDAKNRAKEL